MIYLSWWWGGYINNNLLYQGVRPTKHDSQCPLHFIQDNSVIFIMLEIK